MLPLFVRPELVWTNVSTVDRGECTDSNIPPMAKFNLLIGHWELRGKQLDGQGHYHSFHGSSSVYSAGDNNAIIEEAKMLLGSGRTGAHTMTLATYNVVDKQWELVMVDLLKGSVRQPEFTGRFVGENFVATSCGQDGKGAYCSRVTTFFSGDPDHFLRISDRSYDQGDTWLEAYTRLEMQRT